MDVDDPGWQFGATRAPPAARPPRRDNGREIDALILSCLSDHVYLLIPRDCAAAKRAANGNTVSLRYAPDAEHAKGFCTWIRPAAGIDSNITSDSTLAGP